MIGRRKLLAGAVLGTGVLGVAGALYETTGMASAAPSAHTTASGACGGPTSTSSAPAVVSSSTASAPGVIASSGTARSGFAHPGLLHTQADFDRMAASVKAGAQPVKAGWDRLVANRHSQSTWTARPSAMVVRGGAGQNYPTMYNDIHAAYQNALRWKITGDAAHGNTARDILNLWSSTLTALNGNSDRFLRGCEYVAAYNLGATVPFTAYHWRNGDRCGAQVQTFISSGSRGQIRPVWELVYNHYVKRQGLSAPNTAAFAAKTRPEGGGGDYGPDSGGFDQLGFGTLAYTI